MKSIHLLFLLFPVVAQATQAEECVILLHGLAKSYHSMEKLEESLENEGYKIINYDYPSRSASISALAETHIEAAIKRCPSSETIHFVTHSMGGILVRYYLKNNVIDKLGKVVMLGPPNQGSEIVDTFHNLPGYAWFGGPASTELGTQNNSIPPQLGKVNFEVGIVAGNRSLNPILSALLPSEDDGKVTVNRTKLVGMKDHITMPVTHPFMMKNKQVIRQVKNFLVSGLFLH